MCHCVTYCKGDFFGHANAFYSKSKNIALYCFYNDKYIMSLCDMFYASEMIKKNDVTESCHLVI